MACQPQCSIGVRWCEVSQFLDECRLTEGSEPHYLVLGAQAIKAKIVSDQSVEEPQSIFAGQLIENLRTLASCNADRGRDVLTLPVEA